MCCQGNVTVQGMGIFFWLCPVTWPLTGSFQNGLLPLGPEPLGHELEAEWLEAEGRPKP
jgi:hypothetical protein